ncbi:3'-5' exonuclease [Campylobacter corcagiensis]|uniref:3'-5' exonuclease n=1 Tax=Campylobacter corcagiensis TaxID=1448857 RepID=A0A7M1LJD9_9BACT|nr:3'-5' exonuclease [Campylobacter corcagiensis]QKF64170.1 putative polysaccharide biosynthesis protein [Campylobacter corcagiensis]QOQ87635.1 3'-5' exonuclease [Campylobacter corcagiensis]
MSRYRAIFDCETIPDSDSLRITYGFDGSDEDVANLAFSAQKEKTGSEFLPVNFHKVVAISMVLADEFGKFIRVDSIKGGSEEEIIRNFIKFIDKHNPLLVSFNGRGFDIPMIMIRAMRYNITAFSYFEVKNPMLNKDKWDNYRVRYSSNFHLDLLDFISEHKSVFGFNLDSLCKTLNLPGKYDTKGDQVTRLFYAGCKDIIDEYCQSDTLNTYWLFLKYEILRGNLTIEDYASFLAGMRDYLEKEKPQMSYTPVFHQHIQKELERLGYEI